ncbi:MAG: family 65 glycosyl hydrolase [Actinomycetota bacterium]|nr:family 65 glycosyl hydrolase [Actinomycetota bacterium]
MSPAEDQDAAAVSTSRRQPPRKTRGHFDGREPLIEGDIDATAGARRGPAANDEAPLAVVDPWIVTESTLGLEKLAQTESMFALANGHIGLRGNFNEGEPWAQPGTYLNGFYESRRLPYAEAGYGYPEAGQTVVNVTNGKILRLLVDDEPFDMRYGEVLAHVRELDLRAGVLRRTVTWKSPGQRTIKVSSTRMVSLKQRAMVAIDYHVEVLGSPARVVVQSELVTNEAAPATSADPRVAAALEHPLRGVERAAKDKSVYLIHETERSGLTMVAMMDHVVDGPEGVEVEAEALDDLGRVTFITNLAPGEKLRIVKMISYGWSAERSVPALRDQASAAVAAAWHTGWDLMQVEQREFLDGFWKYADVEIEGDPEFQHAIRFALFHLLQSAARAETRALPGKGLTGPGYDGHAFWDSESFVLPVLTYTFPDAARDALIWRHTILPAAQERAAQLGLCGAAFPWRTIAGEECSAYWPAGTAAFHINADIADAVMRYVAATDNTAFEERYGVDLLVGTARLWCSLGSFDRDSRFRIDGVTGPDEYSAVADNNVYTNLMARRNLRGAADTVERHRERCPEVTNAEIAQWRRAADAMVVAYDDVLGVHPQSEGFTDHDVWDFDATAGRYPLMLHFPYVDLYRKQVVKQADLTLALFACGDEFTDDEKVRDFEYYEPLTVRDSSLSACTQAIMAAETGHLQLAYDYLGEAALMDLDDLDHNTKDGLHMASLAGSWLAVVCGFGGMRDHGGRLAFRPRVPPQLTRLCFNLQWRGCHLRVEVLAESATYTCVNGKPITLTHHGEEVEVTEGCPVTRPIGPIEDRPNPGQPAGRSPQHRRPRHAPRR